ncbi:MAG: hypothetical protein J0I12_01445 [Candidatus Eremiobacteraeota bacterium]|nr:hypothetical protein [Candidatus Eremiobacteraeota bacterium]
MAKSELEQLLERAREQGQLHSTGRFSLDVASASRQFGQYALPEPVSIVARLIRVGALCGGEVQVELAAKKTALTISGHWASVGSLGQSFDQVLSKDPADREFAIALNSLVTRPFLDLRILRGEPGRIGQLVMNKEREVEVAEAVNLVQDGYFTRLEWTTPKGRSISADLARLQAWFRYCRVPILLNGQRLKIPLGHARGPGMLKHLGAAKQVLLKGPWYQPASYFWADHQALEFRLYSPQLERNEVGLPTPSQASALLWAGQQQPQEWANCYLTLSFASDLSQPGRIDWVHRGQLVESEAMEFSLPAVTAVVSCHGLGMDLLGEKLVHNQALDARRQFLRDWLDCLEDELSARYPGAGRELMHKVLFDSRWRKQMVRLPAKRRVDELLRRLSPANQTA